MVASRGRGLLSPDRIRKGDSHGRAPLSVTSATPMGARNHKSSAESRPGLLQGRGQGISQGGWCFLGGGFPGLAADAVDFLLDRELGKAGDRETKKQADAAIEAQERVAKGALDPLRASFYRGRIGNAPIRHQRLAGPDRAFLPSGGVA